MGLDFLESTTKDYGIKDNMMTPIRFKSYYGYGNEVTIIAENITYWEYVDYNGRSGTRIHLSGGEEITVDDCQYEVEKKLNNAFKR